MDRIIIVMGVVAALIVVSSAVVLSMDGSDDSDDTAPEDVPEMSGKRLRIETSAGVLYAVFDSTTAARQLDAALGSGPIHVELEDYGGFEKVGNIGIGLTRDDSSIDTVPGDIVLYNGNKVVFFYGNNTWEYTRLARMADPDIAEIQSILEGDPVTVTLSLED